MLKTLRVRNLATIEDLEVDFGPGFNVLTGETGAGKSILVDALEETCDLLVSIPQTGPLDSLNASVAAGIALFEIVRQRAAGRRPGSGGLPNARRETP